MKTLAKLFSIACSVIVMYACGNNDEPGKSTLQEQFIDVDNSEYIEESLPVGETTMLQTATFDESALPGGTSYLTLKAYEELDYVNIGIQGETGYLKVKLDEPTVAGRATTEEKIYTYTVIVLLSQNLDKSFILTFTTVNKRGEVSSQFTSQTNFVAAGTGELQVNLRFSNEKDVDLYVVEPNGNVIYYGQPFPYYTEEFQAISEWLESDDYYYTEPDIEWGKIGLDVDSNAGCDIDGINSENVFFNTNCIQKGTYQVWVNMFANCDPSIATSYTVRATYKGENISTGFGNNPSSGVFPIGTPDNEIDEELTGATKIMEFTINEGIEPGRSSVAPARNHLLKKEFSLLSTK